MRIKTFFIVATSLALTLSVAYILSATGPLASFRANAAVGEDELSGFAWSSNIGWISFNCANTGTCGSGVGQSNYKVVLDKNTGKLSGFAWSSNIGWIDAGPASGYPTAPGNGATVNMSTGEVTGWMRACGGARNMTNIPSTCDGPSANDWDGWIQFTDAKATMGGFIKNNSASDGGWAWGADIVGWVQFYNTVTGNGVSIPHVDCGFALSPATITPPQSSALGWSCNTYATSCVISGGVTRNGLPISGSISVSPAVNASYVLTCQGFGGPSVKTASLVVGSTSTSSVRIRETNP